MTAERIMIAKKKIVIDAIAADFTEPGKQTLD